MNEDPFALLGLPAWAGLSDDDVRAAWRRIAAATHPDRDDGGDPARFGAAAAAYATLRTGFGRSEALADLAGTSGAGGAGGPRGGDAGRRGARRRGRARHGMAGQRGAAGWTTTAWTRWTGVSAVRAVVAAAVAGLAFLVAGWAPSSIGVLAGVLTWLLVTAGRAVSWRRSRS